MTQALFASIIVPACNAAATIEQTLDSLLRQTWTYMEVVVVDAGSTDDTAERVRAIIGTRGDPRLRMIRRADADLDAARAAGIADARGRYVACCEAGARWMPATLEMHIALDVAQPQAGLRGSDVRMMTISQRPRLKAAALASHGRGHRLAAMFGRGDRAARAAA